jgi:CIC family chloride channel protein
MDKFLRIYETIIDWLSHKLTPRQILVASSILVGLTAGSAAVILKTVVHYIQLAITHDYHIPYQYILYLVFPTIGILLTAWFVQKHLKGKLGRGTANILHAIAKKSSFLPKDQMYSHLITSAVTVGLGGSAGLESPIVVTGSAIGSNYAKTHHINYKDRTLLLACGAAAGIAAAFNSPIAGVLFALEVLLVDVSITAFIPLIIAAATGALLSRIILRENTLFSFKLIQPFDYHNVPYYIVLGLLAGFMSVYYSRVYLKIESFLKSKKKKVYKKALFGGIILAVLILMFPSLYGEGYDSIKTLADMNPEKLFEHSILSGLVTKWSVIIFILATMFLKTAAAAVTIGSGGNGGNFAPSLFVGAYMGFAFAYLLILFGIKVPVSNFTLVAMAGILSGVFHAPLTAIFLIAEITGGYELMIPLMIVSAGSYIITKYFEPYSMDVKRLAKKGHIFTADKDKNILTSLNIENLIEKEFQQVEPYATLGELVEIVANSKRNIFPVVSNGALLGVIVLDNIREVMFKHDMYGKVYVKELMRKPLETITMDERMEDVMKKFDETGAWNLPVLKDGKYIGFISKSSIFVQYRNQLIKTSGEFI